jgi:Protein of unknown function (DUF3034)
MMSFPRRPLRTACLAASLGVSLFTFTPLARAGERLVATSGVMQVEGAGGGGLSPWALTAGRGSRDASGGSAYLTALRTQGGYTLRSGGVAWTWKDTVEVSLSSLRFGLSDTVPGQSVRLDTWGLKWRVAGDAVFDQDRPWPQLSLGLQAKRNADFDGGVPQALGARHGSDVEPYLSAAKVWLGAAGGYNLLGNLTLRATRANQFGILGFGGDQGDRRQLMPEVALAVLLRDNLAAGMEWRRKPDHLSVFREESAADAFIAWFPHPSLGLTLAWVDLGQIADKPGQRGAYLSVLMGY